MRGPKFIAVVRGETGRIGGSVNAESPERAERLAAVAAQGMYYNGHFLTSALRVVDGIEIVGLCGFEVSVRVPYPADMAERCRPDVSCLQCLAMMGSRGVA